MPIRFRCVYCEKLLGIARRKAGAVVSCPHCNEKLIVPSPDEAPEEADAQEGSEEEASVQQVGAAGGGEVPLFERIDIVDELFAPASTFRTGENGDGAHEPLPPPLPKTVRAGAPTHVPPIQQGVVLTNSQMAWLGVATVIVMAVTFGAGLILGRLMK